MTDDAGIFDVKVQLMVYDLIEVDITKHQFTIEFLLEVSWQVLLDADECILRHATCRSHAACKHATLPTLAACQDPTNRAVEGLPFKENYDLSKEKFEPMFPFVQPDAGAKLMPTPRLSFENVIGLRGEER